MMRVGFAEIISTISAFTALFISLIFTRIAAFAYQNSGRVRIRIL